MKGLDSDGRRLILHIGTEKTGSTSIQMFLQRNRSKLNQAGIGVPTCLGDILHFRLQLMANDDDVDDDFIRNLNLHQDLTERRRVLESWRQEFYKEVTNSSAKLWIVSCETLHSRLLRSSELERLRDLLSPLFSSITLLVYLRDPLSLAISRLTEAAKSAMSIALPKPPPKGEFDICDHRETLQRWRGSMGSEDFIVRLFERDFLYEGDVVRDFIHVCGIAPNDYVMPKNHNQSLSAIGLTVVEEINRHVPRRWVDGTLIESRWLLMRHVLQHLRGGRPYQPTADEIALYASHYADINEWVRQHYFPERRALFKTLSTQSKRFNDEVYKVDLARIGRLISNIWLIKTAQIKQLEAYVQYLESVIHASTSVDIELDPSRPSTRWSDYLER